MAASSSTAMKIQKFRDFMVDHELSEDVIEKLANAPWKNTTIAPFYNLFDDAKDIRARLWDAVPEWSKDGSILANLKMAWRQSEGIVNDMVSRKTERVADEDLDEPLGSEVKTSLGSAWTARYDFSTPPSWHGTDALVGRFHRQFVRKSMMTIFLV